MPPNLAFVDDDVTMMNGIRQQARGECARWIQPEDRKGVDLGYYRVFNLNYL